MSSAWSPHDLHNFWQHYDLTQEWIRVSRCARQAALNDYQWQRAENDVCSMLHSLNVGSPTAMAVVGRRPPLSMLAPPALSSQELVTTTAIAMTTTPKIADPVAMNRKGKKAKAVDGRFANSVAIFPLRAKPDNNGGGGSNNNGNRNGKKSLTRSADSSSRTPCNAAKIKPEKMMRESGDG